MSQNRHGDDIGPLTVALSFIPMRLCMAVPYYLSLVVLWADSAQGAEATLNSVRTGVEQWVQTRQLISRTQSDWEADREMLLQSKALLERELAAVAEQRSKVSTNFTQVERERVVAEGERKDADETLDHARLAITGIESRIKELMGLLPAPLVEGLESFLHRLPADPQATQATVTERVQTVVSVLNEIDKFNNAVAVFSEKRANDRGEQVAVETVYLGLGAAYFVNQGGDFAGRGHPGSKGWEWTIDRRLAEPVREVVRIYRSERPARFVALPVTLQ